VQHVSGYSTFSSVDFFGTTDTVALTTSELIVYLYYWFVTEKGRTFVHILKNFDFVTLSKNSLERHCVHRDSKDGIDTKPELSDGPAPNE